MTASASRRTSSPSTHPTTSTTTLTSYSRFPFPSSFSFLKGKLPFPFYISIGGFYRPLPKTFHKKRLGCWTLLALFVRVGLVSFRNTIFASEIIHFLVS